MITIQSSVPAAFDVSSTSAGKRPAEPAWITDAHAAIKAARSQASHVPAQQRSTVTRALDDLSRSLDAYAVTASNVANAARHADGTNVAKLAAVTEQLAPAQAKLASSAASATTALKDAGISTSALSSALSAGALTGISTAATAVGNTGHYPRSVDEAVAQATTQLNALAKDAPHRDEAMGAVNNLKDILSAYNQQRDQLENLRSSRGESSPEFVAARDNLTKQARALDAASADARSKLGQAGVSGDSLIELGVLSSAARDVANGKLDAVNNEIERVGDGLAKHSGKKTGSEIDATVKDLTGGVNSLKTMVNDTSDATVAGYIHSWREAAHTLGRDSKAQAASTKHDLAKYSPLRDVSNVWKGPVAAGAAFERGVSAGVPHASDNAWAYMQPSVMTASIAAGIAGGIGGAVLGLGAKRLSGTQLDAARAARDATIIRRSAANVTTRIRPRSEAAAAPNALPASGSYVPGGARMRAAKSMTWVTRFVGGRLIGAPLARDGSSARIDALATSADVRFSNRLEKAGVRGSAGLTAMRMRMQLASSTGLRGAWSGAWRGALATAAVAGTIGATMPIAKEYGMRTDTMQAALAGSVTVGAVGLLSPTVASMRAGKGFKVSALRGALGWTSGAAFGAWLVQRVSTEKIAAHRQATASSQTPTSRQQV